MKTLLLFLSLLSSSSAFAGDTEVARCSVTSERWPELESGINARTICGETLFALHNSYAPVPEGDTLEIRVLDRATYHVLMAIEWKAAPPAAGYKGRGVLAWSPGDTFVRLLDR